MLEERDGEKFLGKDVAVGVPHSVLNRPFYFYGKVTNIRNGKLVLTFPTGFKEIDLVEIIEIRLQKPRGDH